jgi:hypothetical protein
MDYGWIEALAVDVEDLRLAVVDPDGCVPYAHGLPLMESVPGNGPTGTSFPSKR